ncbi:MAG: hypothetical protein NC212_03990 [Staphylococcus sp.]|nr:hypothetical protein [Staphylococcus sp.]
MRQFNLIRNIVLTCVLAVTGGAAMTSCSDADEPVFDRNFSRSLTDGTESVTYKRKSLRLYDQNSLTNGKWKEVDLSEYCGWQPTSTETIIIQDGKAWTNYSTFSSASGPTLIGRIWNAYLYSTRQNLKLLLCRDFAINEEDNTVVIDLAQFTVGHIDKSSFSLIYFSGYFGGESGKGGTHKEVSEYEAVAHNRIDDSVVAFDSEEQLLRGVIDLARQHFGDVIDLNKVYAGVAIFDRPESQIIDLDWAATQLGVGE